MDISPKPPTAKGPAETFTGATPDDFMTHLSITDGVPHWGNHVTDDEYQGQPTRPDGRLTTAG